MKLLHLLAVAAVVLVGTAALLLLEQSGTPRQSRSTEVEDDAPVERGPAPGFPLALTLRMPDGAAAVEAAVVLEGRMGRQARTDERGRTELRGLLSGRYELFARKGRACAALVLDLEEATDLILDLEAAVAVSGRVLDGRGRPIEGATVEGVGEALAGRAGSGAGGEYQLVLPAERAYRLRALATGFGVEIQRIVLLEADLENVDFHLLPAPAIAGRVIDEAGGPVPGARVVASMRGGLENATHSDGDGAFALPGFAEGRVSLQVRAEGFAPYQRRSLRLPADELTITLDTGLSVRLRAVEDGQPIPGVRVSVGQNMDMHEGETDREGEAILEHVSRNASRWLRAGLTKEGFAPREERFSGLRSVGGAIDLGEIEMSRGGTVRGRVLEHEGTRPVEGAVVGWFGGKSFTFGRLEGGATILSAADGSFLISGVPLDATAMLATHPDYVPEQELGTLLRLIRGKPLFEPGSTLTERDIRLRPARGITGVVLTPDGSPASGADVRATGIHRQFVARDDSEVTADRGGRFEIGCLREGQSVTLVASHPSYGNSRPEKVAAGESAGVTLRLAPPVRVVGRVVDERDRPVAGARVSLVPVSSGDPLGSRALGRGPGMSKPGTTDGEGRFVARNVPAGDVLLKVNHEEFAVLERQLVLPADIEEHDLGKIVLGQGPTIEGVVIGEDGTPMAGIRVHATYRFGEPGVTASAGRTFARATTAADGSFLLAGLRKGRFELRSLGRNLFDDRPVVATGSREVRLVVRSAGTLRGVITAGGRTLAGAFVRAELAQEGRSTFLAGARTREDGSFELSPVPPDLPFDLVLTHAEYRDTRIPGVRVSDTVQEFAVAGGVRVAGVVVDEKGKPVARATVVISIDGERAKALATDAEGRFVLAGLGGGVITVEVQGTADGHVPSDPITVRGGESEIRIVVEAGLVIQGRVVGSGVTGRVTFVIEALDGEGNVAGRAWFWPGRADFTIRGLRKGSYDLRVTRQVAGTSQGVVASLPGVTTGTTDAQIRVD